MTNPLQAQLVHMIFTLVLMIGVIVLLAYLYKKLGYKIANQNKNLTIISSLALGTKEKLFIIQVGDQQLLIGATSNTITTLHELKDPIPIDNNHKPSKRDFKKILEGLKK